jgi:methionyl-tRNA formyltransferase
MDTKKIVLCGCQKIGVTLIEQLYESGINISHIVTITNEKAKQQKVSGYVDYTAVSKRYGIPVYYAEKYSLKSINDERFFIDHKFDLLVQGGWQRLFPDSVLNNIRIGAIGVHGSADFLPKGRGRSPINWSIIEGRERFIFHFFLMKPGVDDGNIFHIEMVDINEWDDCETIYLKNTLVSARCIISNIDSLFNGSIRIYEQQGEPTYYPKRIPEDGKINFNLDMYKLYNFIRAISKPYPGAYGFINGTKITIWKAQPFDTRIDSISNQIGEVIYKEESRFIVKVAGGLLLVTDFEIENNYRLKIFDQIV